MNDEPTPQVELHGRTFTPDMAEISGFGGSYEEGCRLMVLAGLHWLDEHPSAKPQVAHYENIVGIDKNCNEDAEQLERAMLDAPMQGENGEPTTVVKYGATGAMVQYSKMHTLRAKIVGWETYCKESRKQRTKQETVDDD